MSSSSPLGMGEAASVAVLWEDEDRVLRREWRDDGDGKCTTVLAVVSASEPPTTTFIDRLAHEYGLKDELDGPSVVRPLELLRERRQPRLLLEDPGGEPLAGLLGEPMEMGRFLRVASGLSAALRRFHESGFIHKDIKPANVLVDSATGQVWLMGFGVASRLPRERQSREPPEFIAGTLAYMAPEQTGRMNRSVDSRSDLYSLGVTLYEVLTGTLPFAASDPMEWVHCHIAKQPTPPADRVANVPGLVSAIIIKLLAKTAEERYQTAAGVESDLRRCHTQWERERRVDTFPLCQHDTSDRLLGSEKLYGRAREIDTLLAAFDRVVAGGAPELVLVSGYSGIGKSTVVNELNKVIVSPRGLFAAGKFDQYKRDIPYATLAQALRTLVRQILVKSEAELGSWRDSLRQALGPNGWLIVDLVPELKLIIGEQPPIPDLPPQDRQNRFHFVFHRFLGAFARPEHPLALFLDDLQWLDAATLDLLEHLIMHSEVRHLLLVGAYRDNEVSPSHPLQRTLEKIRKAGARVHDIVLTPLGLADVCQLVADALRCTPDRARPLAQSVREKTGGNPFFITQLLAALAEEGLVAFDPITRTWKWDIDRVRAKNYTDNVVDLMARKLKRLPSTTLEALKQLACMGNIAPAGTLALARGTTETAIHKALGEAVHAGLVFRENSTYKFLHDRIQQAAYSLIPEAHRPDVHLRTGRALLANMTVDQLAEHLFDIANHFNRGATRLVEQGEKTQVAAINLRVGRKAKASAAYASAAVHLAAGMALMGSDDLDNPNQYELAFALRVERAECEYLNGNFDEAEGLISELLARAASKIDRAAGYSLKIHLHLIKSEIPQGVDAALECLRLFGIEMPAHPTREEVRAEYEIVWRNLADQPIESLIDLPLMTDPEMHAAMAVLASLTGPALYTDINLYHLHFFKMVSLSLRHGISDASTFGLVGFGVILCVPFQHYAEGYRLGKLACDLVEKHGFTAYKAKVYLSMQMVALWTQPIEFGVELIRAAHRAGAEAGDPSFACFSCMHLVTDLLAQGVHLDDVWRESEVCLDFVRRAKYLDAVDVILSQQQLIRNLRGQTATFSTFGDNAFDERSFEARLAEERMASKVSRYWILKVQARFISGDYRASLAAFEKAEKLHWSSEAFFHSLDYYYYTALTVAALYQDGSADEQRAWRELLALHAEQLREWAENYPPTFADKHALVCAEIARIEGRDSDAMRLYEQAIRSAHKQGFVQNEALAYEVAARFYSASGFETIVDAYLRNARSCYFRWGAEGKVRQLDRLYPHLAAEGQRSTATLGTPIQQLDVASIVKASQAVSSEIELPKLIERLMMLALENAGADRGLLILPAEDDYSIRAEAHAAGEKVDVALCNRDITDITCPDSLLRYVIRTHENVLLDDASGPNLFIQDDYLRGRKPTSILCLPLIKQGQLTGLLYLENTLTSHAFTPDRIAVLELLAAQAAISLDNTRLYSDLHQREAKVRRLVESNIIGVLILDHPEGRIIEANEAFLNMLGYTRADLIAGRLSRAALTPDEWSDATERAQAELRMIGSCKAFEKEYFRKDGTRVPVLVGGAIVGEGRDEGVAFVLDLTERKRAEVEREANLWLLESLDKVNRAIQGTNDLEQMTSDVLDILLSIFACDRAWLVYPCDPEALSWRPTMEHTRPDFPGAFALGMDLPMDADVANVFRAARASSGALQFHSESERAVPTQLAGRFSIQSILGMAVYPKVDKPYMLGLHQCSHSRIWTTQEERVFEAVARRLGDALTGLLTLRDLRESEGKLAEAQHIAHVGHWHHDLDTNRIAWSDENYRIFGLRPQEKSITGAVLRNSIHPDDLERAIQSRARALRGGPPYDAEYRVIRPDGDVRVVHARGNVTRDESGRPRHIFGTVQDITERKHAEAALRERAQLLDLTHDTIFVRNMNDVISFWNRGAEQLYGWSKEEALGQVTRKLLRTTFPSPPEKIMSELLNTGRWEGELAHTKRNGTQLTVASRWSLREDERGQPVGILETNNDITERKRAEYLTGHVFESSPDSICIVGRDYRLQRVNPVFEQLWGSAAVVVGTHIAEVIGTELFEGNSKPSLDRCFAGEEVSIADWYVTARGRRYRVITHSPLRSEQQIVEAALLIGRDFTDYVKASEALRTAQMELAHVNRVTTMGQLTASIAHEVNQPIAGIAASGQAALRWLAREAPDLEAARRSVERVIRDASRAGSVIGRIRALIEKVPPRHDPLNINEAILEVIEVTRSELERNGVSLQTRLAKDLPRIRGDRIQLQQIIMNLIMNAVEAMSEANEGSRDLLISSAQDKPDRVLVAVRDSGPGLDPESLERLFDPFYSTKPGGMGMGLSICRSIIEAHGGQVSATANVPRGAIFHFTIPCDPGGSTTP